METFELDQTVCVIGRGTANLVHRHGRITRTTKTMYVVGYRIKGVPVERRYRKDYPDREVGAHEYGGSSMHSRCQWPDRPQSSC
jgi:hypothetical protein